MSQRFIDRQTDSFFVSGGTPGIPTNGSKSTTIPNNCSGKVECWGVGRATSGTTGMVYILKGAAFRQFTGAPTLVIANQSNIIDMTGDLPAGSTIAFSIVVSGLTLFPQITINCPPDAPVGYEFFVDWTTHMD